MSSVDKSMNDDADSPSFAWQYFIVTCTTSSISLRVALIFNYKYHTIFPTSRNQSPTSY